MQAAMNHTTVNIPISSQSNDAEKTEENHENTISDVGSQTNNTDRMTNKGKGKGKGGKQFQQPKTFQLNHKTNNAWRDYFNT